MVLERGDKLHVVTRRLFDGDLRRHFVGEVEEATDTAARVTGYSFIFDPVQNDYVRSEDPRTRIVGLSGAGNIVHVIPRTVELEQLWYGMSEDRKLMISDDRDFRMEINEFSVSR